jgi:glycosyltransferase involved in cell wall biosynthesis
MRIARVLTRLNLGGPARQCLASDPLLTERGHAVRVFTGTPEPGEGDLFDEARARGIDVVRVPGLRRGLSPFGDLRARGALARLLAAFEPDLLHTHASKAGTLGRVALRRRPDVARVHTFHGHVLEGYFAPAVSRRLVAWERRLADSTDRIVAVSHATADDLVRLGVVGEEKLVVVAPGIELDALLAIPRPASARTGEGGGLRRLVGAGPEAFLVGALGRLAEVKRPEVALSVFATLAQRRPDLHLVFVGDGSGRRDLEHRIRALPESLRARAHIAGALQDMPAVLADLDALLLTSRSEGLPVALIEAAAAALPVVATPVGGVAEVVAHERTGFLGEDEAELAYFLDQLAGDRELRAAMGSRARLRARERFSAARLADRLEQLYAVTLEERRCVS